MPALYQVTAQAITVRSPWRSTVAVPTFWVQAHDADGAVGMAQLILCAGRHHTDAIQLELHGTVIRDEDRSDYAAFEFTVASDMTVTR